MASKVVTSLDVIDTAVPVAIKQLNWHIPSINVEKVKLTVLSSYCVK